MKNRIDSFAGFLLQLLQRLTIPGIHDKGFFADGVSANPQGKPDMRVVKIVWGTYADIIDMSLNRPPSKLLNVAVEPLKLTKK